jgi:hypothetical protein
MALEQISGTPTATTSCDGHVSDMDFSHAHGEIRPT